MTEQELRESEIYLCNEDQMIEGEPRRVDISGHQPVALYKVAGRIYATEDTCSHGHASLGNEGELDRFLIICTWHDGAFDIRTGEPKATPCTKPIKIYDVTIRDGGVHITIPAGYGSPKETS